jgi:hypothetical protein
MDRHHSPQTALTIAFLGGIHLAIIMDMYEEHQTAINIALLGGFYVVFIMTVMKDPRLLLL